MWRTQHFEIACGQAVRKNIELEEERESYSSSETSIDIFLLLDETEDNGDANRMLEDGNQLLEEIAELIPELAMSSIEPISDTD